jgi:predicted DNA-binding protein (UPF0251 family)
MNICSILEIDNIIKDFMRGRPQRKRLIRFMPEITYFKPAGIPLRNLPEVILTFDELEALRLGELEDLDQENAAKKMKISRITFQRILHRAHKKISEALIYGKAIKIFGGEIMTNNQSPKGRRTWGQFAGRGQGLGGSEVCVCPSCKKEFPHDRGIPCMQIKCPECNTPLRGKFCK